MDKKDIAVVIPVYRLPLSGKEKTSLERCLDVLNGYPIVIVQPQGLDTSRFLANYGLERVERFPDACFASLRAYNRLVLEENFYRRFSSYQYMLIYQLDAYVFRDELLQWANRGYDYIGAPWMPRDKYLGFAGRVRLESKRLLCRWFSRKSYLSTKYYAYRVGNGGFSLRNVPQMIDITSFYREKISRLLAEDAPFYPEDVLLLYELTDRRHTLKRPPFREALHFSIETRPDVAYRMNGDQLPFGCHAWYHPDYASFWKTKINGF